MPDWNEVGLAPRPPTCSRCHGQLGLTGRKLAEAMPRGQDHTWDLCDPCWTHFLGWIRGG